MSYQESSAEEQIVIPAEAGIPFPLRGEGRMGEWIPAVAGMTCAVFGSVGFRT